MKTPIRLTLLDRSVDFVMDLDAASVADQMTVFCINRDGTCEPEVTHLMMRVLREGDVAIDGGANVGFFTLLMAKLVGPSGKVLSFEPCTQNRFKLEENIRINGLVNTKVVAKPLWDIATEATLYMEHDGGVASLARSPSSLGSMKLDTTTLNESFEGGLPRLIKLDIEGSEYRALQGGGRFAHPMNIPYIVCEANQEALNRLGASIPQLRSFMALRGYDTFLLNRDGSIPTLLPPTSELVPTALNLNVLFSTLGLVSEAWPKVER